MHGAAAARNRAPLDWMNFFLADVQNGLGPFLAIFLMSAEHWDPARIGLVLTIAGITTVAARGPVGALVDAVTWKRALIGVAALAVGAASVAQALAPHFWPVAIAQAVSGAGDAVFPPAIAGITLGIVGRERFTRRIGRNEAFNHAGNVATAVASGVAGSLIAPGAVLWIGAAMALASIVATYAVRADAIDHEAARGGEEETDDSGGRRPSRLGEIFRCRPMLMFTASITLFHFANAAMLPLVGETLSKGQAQDGSLFMAACIVTAQAAMVPMAVLVGRRADAWGRKPLFLIGFAALPLRGLLFALVQAPWALIAVQLLDGVGAGIFGALFTIVVADLTRGTGRFNLALGASAACWGLGAALSNAIAGWIANLYGYDAAFLFLAACAAGALLLFWAGVPETRGYAESAEAQGFAAVQSA